MSAAQVATGINLELHGSLPRTRGVVAGRRDGGGKARAGTPSLGATEFVAAVVGKMERGDTLADRLAGYGLCGITLFYLAAQAARVVLSF